jgi:hypothetical protein
MKSIVEYKESKDPPSDKIAADVITQNTSNHVLNETLSVIKGHSDEIYYGAEEDKAESDSSFSDCVDVDENGDELVKFNITPSH